MFEKTSGPNNPNNLRKHQAPKDQTENPLKHMVLMGREGLQDAQRDHQYGPRDHQCGCKGGNRFEKGGLENLKKKP